MGGAHSHDRSLEIDERVDAWLWGTVAAIGIVVLVAVAALWPGGTDDGTDPLLLDADPVGADVVSDDVVACSYDATQDCRLIGFVMTDGPYADEYSTMEVAFDSPIRNGHDVLLTVFETEAGRLVFDFYDLERGSALMVLALPFAVAVIALGRWRGLGARTGLVVRFAVIIFCLVPAILDGSDALTVAIVAASLIAFAAMLLAHGFAPSTAVALLSTLLSLFLTAVLASVAVGATRLTGFDRRFQPAAHRVGGRFRCLRDRPRRDRDRRAGSARRHRDTVSAVWELKAVQPQLAMPDLVRPAMRIGRDHISSTVNPLFLA
jgi:hypothetical protein